MPPAPAQTAAAPVTTPTAAAPTTTTQTTTQPVDTTYFKSPTESVSDYQTRIAGYNASKPDASASGISEPAVISSSSIDDEIADAQNRLAQISQKGMTLGPNGAATYADGSAVPAPAGAVYNPNTGLYEATDGSNYSVADFYGENGSSPDPDYTALQQQFAPLKAQLDSNTLSQVNNIESSYNDLIAQQKQNNDQADKARTNSLLLNGTARYAPFDTSGATLATTSFGLQQIKNLDAQENDAISKAQQAQQDGDYKMMTDMLTQAEGIRKQKQDQATTIATNIQAANQKIADGQKQSTIDNGVAELLQGGVTDPADILTQLTGAGIPATAADVAATMKSIATNTGAAGITGLTGDVGNFYKLQATPGALPASILALPQDQQLAAYISMVNQAKKGITGATGASTPSDVASSITGTAVPSVQMTATGDPDPHTQAAFLDALPGGETGSTATLVQGLADYSINPGAFSTRLYAGTGGLTQSDAIALAKEYDPTYDEKQYATRAAMQKNITSGPYSVTVNAANTLIQHLAELQKAAASLPGGQGGISSAGVNLGGGRNIPIVNSVENSFSKNTGGAAVNNFNTALNAVATEAAKVYKGAAPTEGEISEQAGNLSANSSNEQIQGYLKTVIGLMTGRLGTLASNYQQVMGKPAGFSILTPQSIQVLQGMGIDPSTIDPTYGAQPDIGSSSDLSSFLSSASSGMPVNGSAINWGAATVQ